MALTPFPFLRSVRATTPTSLFGSTPDHTQGIPWIGNGCVSHWIGFAAEDRGTREESWVGDSKELVGLQRLAENPLVGRFGGVRGVLQAGLSMSIRSERPVTGEWI